MLPLSNLDNIIVQAIRWAQQAGQIALRYFNQAVIGYKADHSLVTPADIEIEQFLTAQIQLACPGHAIIGEEQTIPCPSEDIDYVWAIDPLDGTTAFVRGLPGWGIALGLLYQAQPIFGLFYMPLLNDLTYTTNTGINCNGHLLTNTILNNWRHKGFLAVSAGAHHEFNLMVPRIRALGSVSASLVYTARGSATAAFIPKADLWDLVAGSHIVNQAGGVVRHLSGSPVDFQALLSGQSVPEPVIAGHPALLSQLDQLIYPQVISYLSTEI